MAEPVWKAVVRQRVATAEFICHRAAELLFHVLRWDLAAPMPAAEAAVWLPYVDDAEDKLRDASDDLANVAAILAAAELIALRGAAASTMAPLPSVGDVPDDGQGLRSALLSLNHARGRARLALGSAGRCRVHLCLAAQLLRHPGLPGVDGVIEDARVAAYGEIRAAWQQASASLVILHFL